MSTKFIFFSIHFPSTNQHETFFDSDFIQLEMGSPWWCPFLLFFLLLCMQRPDYSLLEGDYILGDHFLYDIESKRPELSSPEYIVRIYETLIQPDAIIPPSKPKDGFAYQRLYTVNNSTFLLRVFVNTRKQKLISCYRTTSYQRYLPDRNNNNNSNNNNTTNTNNNNNTSNPNDTSNTNDSGWTIVKRTKKWT